MISGQLVYGYGFMTACGPLEIGKKTITQLYDAKGKGGISCSRLQTVKEKARKERFLDYK